MNDPVLVLSSIAAGLIVFYIGLGIVERRQARRHAANLEAAVEAERRWPFLAIEDFTEDDEVPPAAGRAAVPPWVGPELQAHHDAVAKMRAEPDELEPAVPLDADTYVEVGPGFVHLRCKNARRDGKPVCADCVNVLERVAR